MDNFAKVGISKLGSKLFVSPLAEPDWILVMAPQGTAYPGPAVDGLPVNGSHIGSVKAL